MQCRTELLAAIGSTTRRAVALRPAGGGPIIGLALTRERNPDAPGSVVINETPRARSEAEQMVQSGHALPVWLRARPAGGWTFVGLWRPVAFTGTRGLMRLEPVGDVLATLPSDGPG